MLEFPRSQHDSLYKPRKEFWKSLKWSRDMRFTKFKRDKRRDDKKPFDFGKASWSTVLAVEYYHNVKVPKCSDGFPL